MVVQTKLVLLMTVCLINDGTMLCRCVGALERWSVNYAGERRAESMK